MVNRKNIFNLLRNLKLKNSIKETKDLNTPEAITKIQGKCYLEKPTIELARFNGKMNLKLNEEAEMTEILLTEKNFLLRGQVLRNVLWVFALVVYTGKNTKMSMNQQKPKFKRSLLQIKLNYYILLICVIHQVHSF
jgi:phospholipid-transporting ATPase